MTKRHFLALEKIFAAEISNRYPFQSRAKIYSELNELGLVNPVEIILGGRFPVKIKGWVLTPKGHFEYCQNCWGEPCATSKR